jgi:hypothetical protein
MPKNTYKEFGIAACVLASMLALALAFEKANIGSADSTPRLTNTQSRFQAFDATLYTHKPDFSVYGIKPINLIYGQFLYENGKVDPKALPGQKFIRQLAEEAYKKNQLVVLELEMWPLKGADEDVTKSVQNIIQVLKWFRESRPELQIGLYNVLPIADYWRSITRQGSNEYKEWQRDNERMRPIAEYVDLAFPDIYTHYPDRHGWVQYATENIREAKRYGKPIYVFLWPQYHGGSNKILAHRYVSADYWKLQLETVHAQADGVVIWGGWDFDANRPEPWNENADWWTATKHFMNGLK